MLSFLSAIAPLATKGRVKKGKATLAEADLSALFGLKIEPSMAEVAPKPVRLTKAKKVPGKSRKVSHG